MIEKPYFFLKDESKTDDDEAGVTDHEVPASAPALNDGTKQFTGQDELKEDEIQTTEITTDTENIEAMGNAEKMEISESVGNSKPEMKVDEDIFKAGEVFNSNEIAGNDNKDSMEINTDDLKKERTGSVDSTGGSGKKKDKKEKKKSKDRLLSTDDEGLEVGGETGSSSRKLKVRINICCFGPLLPSNQDFIKRQYDIFTEFNH